MFPMDSDETKFLPRHQPTPEPKKADENPFEIGESTIFQMRNQDFEPVESLSTNPSAGPEEGSAETPFAPMGAAPDEFGTMMQRPSPLQTIANEPLPPLDFPTSAPEPVAQSPETAAPEDPLARIEHKLDLALRQLQTLQHRIESLDATIARSLLR
jgi:hypothetical protein